MRPGQLCTKLVMIICGCAGTAFAHPGHGATEPNTVQHYLTEPVHVAPLMLVVAVAAVTISLLAGRKRHSQNA